MMAASSASCGLDAVDRRGIWVMSLGHVGHGSVVVCIHVLCCRRPIRRSTDDAAVANQDLRSRCTTNNVDVIRPHVCNNNDRRTARAISVLETIRKPPLVKA